MRINVRVRPSAPATDPLKYAVTCEIEVAASIESSQVAQLAD